MKKQPQPASKTTPRLEHNQIRILKKTYKGDPWKNNLSPDPKPPPGLEITKSVYLEKEF